MASDDKLDARVPEMAEEPPVQESAGRTDRRFGKKLAMLALVATGLALGGLSQLAFQRLSGPQSPPPSTSAAAANPTAGDSTHRAPAVSHDVPPADPPVAISELRRADRLLSSGSAAQSLEIYGRLLKYETARPRHAKLLYRIAVAQELIGDVGNAMTNYRGLVGSADDRGLIAAAKLGQARIWVLRHQPDLAIALLADLALTHPPADKPDQNFHGGTLFLLGFAHFAAAGTHHPGNAPRDVLATRSCAWISPTWQPEWLLAIPQFAAHVQPVEANRIDVLYQIGQQPSQTQLNVWLQRQPVTGSIEAVADKLGLAVRFSAAAKDALLNREQAIQLPNASLATFLDLMLAQFDLVWNFEDQQLSIVSTAECEKSQVLADRAARTLRRAVAEFPNSPLAPFVYLALGNSAYLQRDWLEAEGHYRQILRQYAEASVAVEANFNLAQVNVALGNRQDALNTFYNVVDMAPGHYLATPAYVYVGTMHIESGNVAAAIRPLLRAAKLSHTPVDEAIAATTLASAYLLADNHHAANTVLMEYRTAVAEGSQRRAAALIAAMARLETSASATGSIQQGRALVTAINRVAPSDFFHAASWLVVGEGMQLIGLLDQAEELYLSSLRTQLPAWVEHQVRLRLVEHYLQVGKSSATRPHLEILRQATDAETSHTAKVLLAKLDMQNGSWTDGMASCREILNDDLSEAHKSEVLQIMGRMFESQSQHYEAALCFAGMVPPELTPAPDSSLHDLPVMHQPAIDLLGPE